MSLQHQLQQPYARDMWQLILHAQSDIAHGDRTQLARRSDRRLGPRVPFPAPSPETCACHPPATTSQMTPPAHQSPNPFPNFSFSAFQRFSFFPTPPSPGSWPSAAPGSCWRWWKRHRSCGGSRVFPGQLQHLKAQCWGKPKTSFGLQSVEVGSQLGNKIPPLCLNQSGLRKCQ